MKALGEISEGHQGLYSNLIHSYVLHHACHESTFGLQIIEEVAQLGYKLSPGTVYPLLDTLERKGLLRSREVKAGGTARRIYRATRAGHKAYVAAKEHVSKLLDAISQTETHSVKKRNRISHA